MIVDIIEDITQELPRYILNNDGTVELESTGNTRVVKRKPSPVSQESFLEGAEEIHEEKTHKRSAKLRSDAIKEYGLICYVCKCNFEDVYGQYGAGYIEVHHLELIANLKGENEVTVNDVRVVCSNCHSVLHRQGRQPMDIDKLKEFVKARRAKGNSQS